MSTHASALARLRVSSFDCLPSPRLLLLSAFPSARARPKVSFQEMNLQARNRSAVREAGGLAVTSFLDNLVLLGHSLDAT